MIFIITSHLTKPSFFINLDYLFSIFNKFLMLFQLILSIFSTSVSFRQSTSPSKKKYHNKNKDICTRSPPHSRWHKVYILIYLIYNKTLDGTMVNIILASITIWPNFSKSHHDIYNHLKSDQTFIFHKFRLFFSIFNEFLMLFQVFLPIFSTSVSFRQLPPAH